MATTQELSELADARLAQALLTRRRPLQERYGRPQHAGEDGHRTPTGFAVIALGKHGGAELNYSSDIDLSSTRRRPTAREVVSSRTYFARLGERLWGR